MLACPNSFIRSYTAGVHLAGNLRAVVAREDQKGFIRNAAPLQRVEYLADHVISLHHEVPVLACLALPFERRRGHDRIVGRREGQIEEERLATLRGLLDVLDRTLFQSRQHLDEFPVGNHRAGDVEGVAPDGRSGRGDADGAVVLQEAVRRIVRNVGPEVDVEAAGGRPVGNRPGEVPLAAVAGPGPPPAEVPLADTRSGVPLLAEQPGDRELLLRDERLRERADHVPLQPRPPRVPAGEQGVAGRRADRGGRVRVREPHPLSGQPIDVRRGYLRGRVVTADVAVPEVVRQNVDDVRLRRLGGIQRADTATLLPP